MDEVTRLRKVLKGYSLHRIARVTRIDAGRLRRIRDGQVSPTFEIYSKVMDLIVEDAVLALPLLLHATVRASRGESPASARNDG